MSIDKEVEILRQIPLFANIEPVKLKLMAFASERITFQTGQALFSHGDEGDAAYIIVDGEADILVDTPSGPLTVAKVGKNEIVGEIAILCDVPRTATVKATEQLETLKISKELFFRLIKEFPDISIEIMRELAERLERTTGQLQRALRQQQG